MFYQAFSIGLAVVALVLLLAGLRVLLRKHWFLTWLRGSLAMLTIAVAIALALVAADIYSYRLIRDETTIATLSIKKLADQDYQITLAEAGSTTPREFDVKGDLWQLDARILTWKGPLRLLGMKPGYRLDRLSGRYMSLEQETSAPRTVYAVQSSQVGVDFWAWVKASGWVPWVDADYGTATFMPLQDGAQYGVLLNNQGMLARPLNTPAVDAVESWH